MLFGLSWLGFGASPKGFITQNIDRTEMYALSDGVKMDCSSDNPKK